MCELVQDARKRDCNRSDEDGDRRPAREDGEPHASGSTEWGAWSGRTCRRQWRSGRWRPTSSTRSSGRSRAIPGKHRERLAGPARGECVYLIAWVGDEPVGHLNLRLRGRKLPDRARRLRAAQIEDLRVARGASPARGRHRADAPRRGEAARRRLPDDRAGRGHRQRPARGACTAQEGYEESGLGRFVVSYPVHRRGRRRAPGARDVHLPAQARWPDVDADAVEIRVLGCLIEKQRTTPETYPLSLNALRLACNQSTNRDPVVDYDEHTIREGLNRLSRRGWARLASGPGSRAVKFRHLFDEALGLTSEQTALLAVLMLRGPQTPGELKQRTQRLHAFEGLDEIARALERADRARPRAPARPRRPGQKEERYEHLLSEDGARRRPPSPAERANQGRSPTGSPSSSAKSQTSAARSPSCATSCAGRVSSRAPRPRPRSVAPRAGR